jgi:hypothetical protein
MVYAITGIFSLQVICNGDFEILAAEDFIVQVFFHI